MLPDLGQQRQDIGFLGLQAGGTASVHLDGGVLEMSLLAGVPGVDRHHAVDVVGTYLDERAVEICRHGQQQ